MQRILDIDLDFFVTPVVHWPPDDERPSSEDYSVWPIAEAIEFLREKFGLAGRLPGFLTENHGELFPRWREAISVGLLKPPFHVTHLDAHADLGLGDSGYVYLMSSLLFDSPEDRQYPRAGATGLNDGNFLLFATACRWIHDLTYVYGDGGGSDELFFAMKDFKSRSDHIQLAAMGTREIDKMIRARPGSYNPVVSHFEPAVPYRTSHWDSFQADGPFDFVCLTSLDLSCGSRAGLAVSDWSW
ncbi:UPF0489 family protein [Rhodococcus zopfii]|uniref:UPF0489 family protein n=2 Tax=Rhodococcus zopfii TaxID=43772 RepID=UPI001EDEB3CF|nr:UPF0489 family protein [Rhodococcus zopfii]